MEDQSDNDFSSSKDLVMTSPPWSQGDKGDEKPKPELDKKNIFKVLKRIIPVLLFSITFNCSYIGTNTMLPQYILNRFQRDDSNLSSIMANGTSNPCHVNESDPLYKTCTEVQQLSSNFLAAASFVGGIPNMVSVMILGALSDKLGRKKVIYISYVGMTILAVGLSLIISLDLPLLLYFFLAFISGACGSIGVMFAAIYAYVADITIRQERAPVLATVDFTIAISVALVNLTLGAIIGAVGFVVPMIGLTVICLVSILFMIPVDETAPDIGTTMSSCQVIMAPFTSMKMLLTLNQRRSVAIILLAIALMLYLLVTNAGAAVSTLYLMGAPFHWDSLDLGVYNALKIFIIMIFCGSTIVFFGQRINNDIIIIAGYTSNIATHLVIAFASSIPKPGCDISMIVSIIVGVFAPISGVYTRSQASRLVGPEEQGTIFGLMSTGETFATSFGPTISGAIYGATVVFLPGLVFYFLDILLFIALVLVVVYKIVAMSLSKVLYYTERIN